MLSTTTGSAGVQINGINYNREKEISGLDKKIIMGDGLLVNQKQSILIGKKLADKLKLKTGKKLVLTFTDTASNLVSAAFRVASLYRSDNAPFDEKNVYIEQGMLNELLGIRNGVHEIVVLLKDDNQTEYVKNLLTEKFPSLQIETWKALSPETDLLINTVDVYAYIIIIIILLALSFGIINTMMMAVLERSHEIGMLMALGMDKKKIFSMIMAETVLLTLTGTPLGLGLSQILVHYYHMHGMDWSGMGKEMMSSFGFSSIIYPQYPNEKIPIVIAMVIITALFSCILPALRALNLTPIAALRK
jgi:ABC-type lipoprotein release transport system permease subunit